MDWKEIKAEYATGDISYRDLAKKHDVSFSTLSKVAKREGWSKLRKQACEKEDAKIASVVGKQNAKRAIKILQVADTLLDKIGSTIDSMDVIDAQSIKQLTSALKDLKDIKGIKSEADMLEQVARIKKLQKEVENTDNDQSKSVVVRIEGGANEAWLK